MKWLYYNIKSWILLMCFSIVKHYTMYNLNELRGTEILYCSNTLCMDVYISAVSEKGITLMGRWYDTVDCEYEKEDSVIFCINRETADYDITAFLKKINESVHTGIWLHRCCKPSYFKGGRIDNLCAFK